MPATTNFFAAALGIGLAAGAIAWAQDTGTQVEEDAPAARQSAPAEAEDAPAQDETAPAEGTTAAPAEADASDPEALPEEEPAESAAPAGEAPEGGETDPAAQEAEEGAGEDGAADAAGAEPGAGEVLEVVRATYEDWEVRCLPDETECFMYQLALDAEENPVAEISLIRLPDGSDADAGMTVVSPLGTLLTEGLVLQIDTGEARQYPFSFCSQVGCFARFGLDANAIGAMKRGNAGSVRLVPIATPDEPIELRLSLSGFTAAYDSLSPTSIGN